MSSQDNCKKCGSKQYTHIWSSWCKTCHTNNFKTNLIKSGNEKIDDIIQAMQLKINNSDDVVFEWIPYNKFDNIEEINKGDFATVYSAVWKDGLLSYDYDKNEYLRSSDKKVALKCLHNSQIITDEFLNEVWNFFMN